MAPYRYVSVGELDGSPHVLVDGAPRQGTALTLSHWPGTPTPRELWADLSAEIVLNAMARPALLPDAVDAASIDHYDADGAISLALLCTEGLAESHGSQLVDAARVGDFGVVRDRSAALVAFALEALHALDGPAGTPDVSDASEFDQHRWGSTERCRRAADEALRILPELVVDPWSHEELWGGEAAAFDVATDALTQGWAGIEERPEHDLAVVRVDVEHPRAAGAGWNGAPLHRAAVYSATDRLRVLTVAGDHLDFRYRYESWVRLVSRRPRPRVDLARAAQALTEIEPSGARWVFEGAGAVTASLRPAGGGKSGLAHHVFEDIVADHLGVLDAGEPAWDPFAVPISL